MPVISSEVGWEVGKKLKNGNMHAGSIQVDVAP